jgi:hypothetical protein
MKAFLTAITPQLLEALATVLMAAIGWASFRLAGYIKAHTKNAQVQGVLLRLNDAVFHAVSSLEQTVVVAAKLSAQDGRLTAVAGAAVKGAAIASIKTHLGKAGVAELQSVLGVKAEALDAFLSDRIETSVLHLPVTSQVEPQAREAGREVES